MGYERIQRKLTSDEESIPVREERREESDVMGSGDFLQVTNKTSGP